MTRRFSLPMSPPGPPSAAAIRKRLGGRLLAPTAPTAPTAPDALAPDDLLRAGHPVSLDGRPGVLLVAGRDDADVYIADGIVKRTRRDALSRYDGALPAELEAVSQAATVFGGLGENDAVEVERAPGDVVAATLAEKCRYGALVRLADGTVLGVGFRKIWPAPARDGLAN